MPRHGKSVITCVTIASTFIFLWIPFVVTTVMFLTKQLDLTYVSGFAGSFLAMLNGVADPVVLVLFNRDVRKLVCNNRNNVASKGGDGGHVQTNNRAVAIESA